MKHFITALLCVTAMASTTVANASGLDEGRFTITGRLHAAEQRTDSLGPIEDWLFILVREGSETYDVAVRCPVPDRCWEAASFWFGCTPTTTSQVDPYDSGVTIWRKTCTPSTTPNRCIKGQGTLQNHPDPATHFGSALSAETIGDVKEFNCAS